MFIINNGYAYIIKGNKAYKVDFNENEAMVPCKNDADYEISDIKGYTKYSYKEIYSKLNVKYHAVLKKQQALANENGTDINVDTEEEPKKTTTVKNKTVENNSTTEKDVDK